MDALISEAFSFPLIVYTIPLILFAVFWLFSLLGAVDMETFDIDLDTDGESDVATSWFEKLGLSGVPLVIALTFVDFYAFIITYMGRKFLQPFLDGIVSGIAAGTIIALLALIIAIPVSALCIKPIRRFFVTHEGERKDELHGTKCTVMTSSVSATFGQAQGDDGMVFSIRAPEPNQLKKGSRVVLLEYSKADDTYSVVAEAELMAMSSSPTTI